MKRFILAAGVAALAITVPAVADPGDKGRGNGRDRGAQVDRGDRDRAERRSERRAEVRQRMAERRENARERSSDRRERIAERRSEAREKALERRQEARERMSERRQEARERVAERRRDAIENRRERAQRIAERRRDAYDDRREAIENRRERLERMSERRRDAYERRDRDLRRMAERRRAAFENRGWDDWDELARRGVWLDGCPPGLAKKPVPCVPPGQAKKLVGEPLSAVKQRVAFRDLPQQLRYVYRDTPDHYYRYGDGYMYRVNRTNDVVSALLPLFGLGYTVGQQFPSAYSNYYLPSAYQPFYPSTPNYDYRYANGYVYQVDPMSGMIYDVDPMLGYGYGYGQMLPATYSAYNVPYQYRPMYYDTPDHYYRYAPGAIYQVDPETSLITAVAALLTGGMTVGQPLPSGYGVYNVPYDYRNRYYDTQNDWYRYANGNIYRVDPTTQLVTAIVASILT